MSAPALTRPTAPPRTADPNAGLPANALGTEKGTVEQVTLYVFVIVPFLALAAIVPAVWGWGLSWTDVGLVVGFYFLTLLGVTVGYHRHFTHGSFKADRPLRVALAAVGGMAIQGPVVQWVADHRRHHAFADREGDPHSPWRYGSGARDLLKGMFHAHLGWLFDRRQTNADRYAPDLVKDTAVRRTSRLFILWAFLSLRPARPSSAAWSRMSWAGAWSAFFWAGLVRVALLHHVTWSINSVCHVVGNRPFASPRPGDELLAAGDPQRRRVLAQPAPRRPDLRPPRRAARPDRHQRPGHLVRSRSSAGPGTSSGPTRSGWPPSAATPSRPPDRRRSRRIPRPGDLHPQVARAAAPDGARHEPRR